MLSFPISINYFCSSLMVFPVGRHGIDISPPGNLHLRLTCSCSVMLMVKTKPCLMATSCPAFYLAIADQFIFSICG